MAFIPASHRRTFAEITRLDDSGNEYWSARDLAQVLEYSEYRHFLPVIHKAKLACKNSGHPVENHFEDVLEMVTIGSSAQRKIETCYLSRYACYLIIQNADPSKEIVASGQTYFAAQTRRQELQDDGQLENEKRMFLREEMKQHNKHLASAAKEAGVVSGKDYAIFQDHGYRGLYGGLGARDIHIRKGLKKSQKILDHMGSTELAANLFRATQTEDKLRRENIHGKSQANLAHHQIGRKVRKTIAEIGGTMPEDLPPAENIQTLERRKKKGISGE